jgi:hypothetical protein
MNNWKVLGIAVEGEPIEIGGIDIWSQKWELCNNPPVELSHPSYTNQLHTMSIYKVSLAGKSIIFAAGELSAYVWGFYVPA